MLNKIQKVRSDFCAPWQYNSTVLFVFFFRKNTNTLKTNQKAKP